MTDKKKQFLLNEMSKSGLQKGEARLYLLYNERCNWESMTRRWRRHAIKEDKNYEAEKQYKNEYSISHSELKRKERLEREAKYKKDNNTLF